MKSFTLRINNFTLNLNFEYQYIFFRYSKAYMDEGTYMLTSVDEIQLLLDDQIVKTQAMQQSRFIEPFRDRATAWEKVSA